MTPHGGPMSENEKTIWICLLFPIFWPFLPAVLLCMLGEAIRDRTSGWRWRLSCRWRGTCPTCNWPLTEWGYPQQSDQSK